MRAPSDFRLALVLAVAVALGPFALDAYLPAFPAIAATLGVGLGDVGLTLSVYVIGLAAGQIIGGPLSDRYGRRPIMYGGLAVFIIGSVLVALSNSLSLMLVARSVQAFGGGWVAVCVPAIVRDRVSGNEAARLFSLIALIMFIAPALAPSLGTLLLHWAGWQAVFVYLAGYGAVVTLLMRLTIFRGPPPPRNVRQPMMRLLTNYAVVLRHAAALRFIALQTMVFSIMLVYLTHASFIYQDWLGLSETGFSLLFAGNVVTMAGFSILNRRLLTRWPALSVLPVMVCLQAAAVLLLLLVVLLDAPRLLSVPVLMLMIGSMGGIAPNNLASVMEFFRELGGTAAALMGAAPFAIGGVVSGLSSQWAAHAMSGVAGVMTVCALAGIALVFSARGAALSHIQ